MRVLILVLALTGCATPGVGDLPSVKYCETVQYSRTGDVVDIKAQCRVR
jgi:hypothetical protein